MEILHEALILAAVALIAALIAGGLPIMKGIGSDNRQKMMTGIAAGVLLASAILVAIPEGFAIAGEHEEEEGDGHDHGEESHAEEEEEHHELSSLALGGAILAGFLMMLILEAFGFGHDIHEEHHDHEADHGHDHVHHPSNATSVVFGLSIHALTDGLAMGAAIATGELHIAMAVSIAVIAHKVPAAFSVGVFSMHEREDSSKAWKDLIMFSLATPIMIIISALALGDLSHELIGLAILFAAGTFLYVATVDVLPDIHHGESGRKALRYVMAGALIMIIVLLAIAEITAGAHAH